RTALDYALAEIDRGAKVPSTKWRRRYALLLGLERVLSEDEPRLADGTLLNPHQVDALSGTLVALLAQAQKGDDATDEDDEEHASPVLSVEEDPPEEDDEDDEGLDDDEEGRAGSDAAPEEESDDDRPAGEL